MYQQSHSVAMYLTCDRLNEVDTSSIMHTTLQEGRPSSLARSRNRVYILHDWVCSLEIVRVK